MSEERETEFKGGDKVVCIDAQPRGHECDTMLSKLGELVEGQTYTVAAAYDYREATGSFGLILHEIETPFPMSWIGDRFRLAAMTNEHTDPVIERAWRTLACDLCVAMRTDVGQITLHWAEEYLRERADDISRLTRAGVSRQGEVTDAMIEIGARAIESGWGNPDTFAGKVSDTARRDANVCLEAVFKAIGDGSVG